jgi:hypothetical protein
MVSPGPGADLANLREKSILLYSVQSLGSSKLQLPRFVNVPDGAVVAAEICEALDVRALSTADVCRCCKEDAMEMPVGENSE